MFCSSTQLKNTRASHYRFSLSLLRRTQILLQITRCIPTSSPWARVSDAPPRMQKLWEGRAGKKNVHQGCDRGRGAQGGDQLKDRIEVDLRHTSMMRYASSDLKKHIGLGKFKEVRNNSNSIEISGKSIYHHTAGQE